MRHIRARKHPCTRSQHPPEQNKGRGSPANRTSKAPLGHLFDADFLAGGLDIFKTLKASTYFPDGVRLFHPKLLAWHAVTGWLRVRGGQIL